MSLKGWYQVAFERDLEETVTPAGVGDLKLALIRRPDGQVQAFDAVCPHRGANLALGGELDGDRIRCPFHGFSIGLGDEGERGFTVCEHPVLSLGGLVFVRLADGDDRGFAAFMNEIDAGHYIVPGFAIRARAEPSLVIENAFDSAHFRTVHGVLNEPNLQVAPSESGEFSVTGIFTVPPSRWQKTSGADSQDVEYRARAFSPWIVVSSMLGPNPYWVITAATPLPNGETVIRLSYAMPPDEQGQPPADDLCRYMLDQSRKGLEQDRVIWETMDLGQQTRWTDLDTSVQGFQAFVEEFLEAS